MILAIVFPTDYKYRKHVFKMHKKGLGFLDVLDYHFKNVMVFVKLGLVWCTVPCV